MNRKIKLVHLDDHMIFRAGVQKAIDPEKKIFFIQGFVDSRDALRYIRNSLDSGERIDLILTDFRHLGDDGYAFAKSVRNYEADFSVSIPILLLTMYRADFDLIQLGLKEGLFNYYLPKSADTFEILRTMSKLMNGDSSCT